MMKSSGRGGARVGGGRPSEWQHTPTKTIRVPEDFAPVLLEVAKKLDEGLDDVIVIDPKSLSVEQQMKKKRLPLSALLHLYKHSGHEVVRVKELISALESLLKSN
jgi:hypothetical protein